MLLIIAIFLCVLFILKVFLREEDLTPLLCPSFSYIPLLFLGTWTLLAFFRPSPSVLRPYQSHQFFHWVTVLLGLSPLDWPESTYPLSLPIIFELPIKG